MNSWIIISLILCVFGALGVWIIVKQLVKKDKDPLMVSAAAFPLLSLGAIGVVFILNEGALFDDRKSQIAFAVMIISCIYAAVVVQYENKNHDTITIGTIERIITLPYALSKKGYFCTFVVKYQVEGKEYLEGSKNTVEGSEYKVGQSVTIKYNSRNPRSFQVMDNQ